MDITLRKRQLRRKMHVVYPVPGGELRLVVAASADNHGVSRGSGNRFLETGRAYFWVKASEAKPKERVVVLRILDDRSGEEITFREKLVSLQTRLGDTALDNDLRLHFYVSPPMHADWEAAALQASSLTTLAEESYNSEWEIERRGLLQRLEVAAIQRRTLADDLHTARTKLAHALVREASDRQPPECVICLDHVVGVAFEPCHHVCVCADCAATLLTCPICRVGVASATKLIFA